MSEKNVDVVQATFEAWNAGDMDAFCALHDPNVIWVGLEGWPEAETLVGREACMSQYERMRAAFDVDAVEPITDFIAAGDRVVVRFIWRGNEVKELGGNGTTTPTLRTPEQTALARFYTVNPVEMFSRTFRAISEAEGLTLVEEARLFAMLNMAGADGLINCWDDKAFWSFWRPITAIRDGDDDGNHKTVGDAEWTSLIPSPPYPDHPSGYSCVTSSFMHTAKAFFGKGKMAFGVTAFIGTPPAPVTRDYKRFRDVVDDTIDARVYLGIHFRAPDVQGAPGSASTSPTGSTSTTSSR